MWDKKVALYVALFKQVVVDSFNTKSCLGWSDTKTALGAKSFFELVIEISSLNVELTFSP